GTAGAAQRMTSTGAIINAIVLETGSATDIVPAKIVQWMPTSIRTNNG
ncbi:unnamed protein product, partial [marine sediment metagenome]